MRVRIIAVSFLFLLVAFAIFSAFMAIYSPEEYTPDFAPTIIDMGPAGGTECDSGNRVPCTTEDGCNGIKSCLHGYWSSCRTITECVPGQKRFCPSGTCNNGIQECNRCGTWGQCIPPLQ